MSAALRGIGRQLDDPASLGTAIDELIAGRREPPTVLALGEPTHGIEAFPLLRNELLGQLVRRGYRSIALETDFFAASVVDDYVNGAATDVEDVLATGFSHGFGAVPGNRELVRWLREYNADRAERERVRFYGFDAPLEYSGAPSPVPSLRFAGAYLPQALRPVSVRDVDGDDSDDGAVWSNPAAMYDPAASIGNSDRARALRVAADDVTGALRRAAPLLRRADPGGYALAVAHARTARGLSRYHAAMATSSPDRVGALLGVRAEMMADNLLAIVERERRRGPVLAFAHNVHLLAGQSRMPSGEQEASWGSAGSLVALELGERYLFLATDAAPQAEPDTLQGLLAAATTRRALFPAPALRAALPASIGAGEPIVRGHLPLTPGELEGADAVIFVADTDGERHGFW
ncbi:erythromycin esterase family protein [Saccharomonospora sp. NPDC006951]